MKTCTKCGVEKPFDEFYKCDKNKDGYSYSCKTCDNQYKKIYTKKHKEKLIESNKAYIKNNNLYYEKNKKKLKEIKEKICTKCKQNVKINNFYKDKNRKDKLSVWCKDCSKKQYLKNRDDRCAYGRSYTKKNKYQRRKKAIKWLNSNSKFDSTLAKNISWADYIEEGENGLLLVKCKYCGKKFNPKIREVTNRKKAINNKGTDTQGFYCSSGCKKACPTFHRKKHYKGQKIDGSSREVQPELRQMCLERDKYTCQKCGTKGKTVQLHCHHIKSLADDPIESADVDNTITLCKSCHKEAHKIAGCNYYELRC